MPETTIQQFLDFYADESLARSEAAPAWPPDAFALAAALLLESGSYLVPCREWPPGSEGKTPDSWARRMKQVGRRWRESWPSGAPPREVSAWWRLIRKHGSLPVSRIGSDESRKLCHSLLQLLAAADEASHSVGVQMSSPDPFSLEAEIRLIPQRMLGSTLCRNIHPTKLRVLPKFHTPQTGITVRSLSHHLALWMGNEVTPLWFTAPIRSQAPKGPERRRRHSLNLLLVPWPERVRPRQFGPATPAWGRLRQMKGQGFGFFIYRHESPAGAAQRIQRIYKAAEEIAGPVDGVVLPELALNQREFNKIRDLVGARKGFLIAGIGEKGSKDLPWSNRIGIEVPTEGHRIPAFQRKHHRWRLDRSQIVQYGLGGQLDPAISWWEYAEAEERRLTFLSLDDWLSVCALLCEDLARQDPVARLVRAVGPNLVITLLMDGPQLPSRWSARYATVLADDPGSSVLTLTSIGMCELSRPPDKTPSRTIALWKDAHSGQAVPIELPAGADGILLNLVRRMGEEWSADGRSDGGGAGYPALAGVHPVFLREPVSRQRRNPRRRGEPAA